SLGGDERVCVLLTEWLHDNDKSVALFTLNRDREEGYVLKEGVRRIAINENSQNSKLSIIINLRNQIKRYKPTVILVMGVPPSVFVVPAVTFLGIPVIISERNDPSKFMGKYTTKLFSRLFMRLDQGYIFQTSNAKSYYSTGVQKKGKIIPNPLTTDNIPKPYKGLRKKKIVSVGRLVPQKNHEMLIKAFNDVLKSYPEYTLTIYGNGNEYNNLKDLIERLGINENVFLPGTTSNIFKQILDAQIFVLSSRFEGMPNALIEAMALGIPVISTNC